MNMPSRNQDFALKSKSSENQQTLLPNFKSLETLPLPYRVQPEDVGFTW